MTEMDIQRGICEVVAMMGWLTVRINAGGVKTEGGSLGGVRLAPPGMPDLLLVGPGGRTIFVEVKRPGKRLTSAQQTMHATLEALGHRVVVVNDVAMVPALLADGGR